MTPLAHDDPFDIIVIGAGAAGLSFAFRASQEPSLANRRILMIDPAKKNKNDRTWCFWADRPLWVDEIAYRKWKRLGFHSTHHDEIYDLGNYEYRMVRGIDFYDYTKSVIAENQNIQFIDGSVESLIDGISHAKVFINGNEYRSRFVLKGAFLPGDFHPDPKHYHYLKQHFKGWLIRSPNPIFDPTTPILFDFRTRQSGAMRFIYTLPLSETESLVEYTLFSEDLLGEEEYDSALQEYIMDILQIDDYEIMETEVGIIPMTDHPYTRRLDDRILAIGTPGGMVKPSSGYAFHRILNDTEQIIASLIQNDHPFAIQPPPWHYRFFDSTMLNVMKHDGDKMELLFSQMFKNNNIQRIFNFLDETDPIPRNIPLLLSVDPIPFLKAVIRLYLLRTI